MYPYLGGPASTRVPHVPTSPVCAVYLVRVCVEIKVLQEAGRKFTEEEVVGLVDGPHAPVCVIVGAGAGAEGAHCQGKKPNCQREPDPQPVSARTLDPRCWGSWAGKEALKLGARWATEAQGNPYHPVPVGSLTRPERRRLPVLVVMGKARQARHAACVIVLQSLEQLAKFLLALLLPQQPHFVLLL